MKTNKFIDNFVLIVAGGLMFFACKQPQAELTIPYKINKPTATFLLPKVLREISGLAFYNQNEILCVEDESGTIYRYSLDKKSITGQISFDKHGDFEGIEVVDSFIYVASSNGTIFKVQDQFELKKKMHSTVKITTSLKARNDVEGLCFNRTTNTLLVACKGISPKTEYPGKQLIFSFDFENQTLSKTPLFQIDPQEVLAQKHIGVSQKAYEKFQFYLGGNVSFRPSAIAVHPISEHIYILSSIGKTLVVLNQAGDLIEIAELNPTVFAQPEGIAFGASGKMYISNEGQEKRSNILEFDYNPNKN